MMDAFLHACGVHPALELEVQATSKVRAVRYSLRQPFAIVGRHPAADVYLDSDGIRPRHVYFQAIEGRIACINVSQTGTIQTSEAEVENFCWLAPNDTIHFGNRSLKFVQDEDNELHTGHTILDPLAIGSAWDIFGPRITLEITNDNISDSRKTWLVDRLLTLVGRTPRCALQLHDEEISNVHCSLVLTTTGLWVVDLLGRGGVIINEQPVRTGQLGLEDELRLGPFRIRLQEMPIAINIPGEERAFRPLTPAGEIHLPPAEHGSHHQIRMYHTPWPEDASHADVLEELMDKLQDMQGPMFAQYQHIIAKMVETVDQLDPAQQEEVRRELERLKSLQDEMATIQQAEAEVQPAGSIVVPASSERPSQMELILPPATSETIHLDTLESSGSFRSAASLLKESDTSVFRMPKKMGDLFESIPTPYETVSEHPAGEEPEPEPEVEDWNHPDTELLTGEMVETEAAAEQYTDAEADDYADLDDGSTEAGGSTHEGVTYGYDPEQHEEAHPDTEEFQPFTLPPGAAPAQTDEEKAAHLWLHDRIDHLEQQQSSIWQKLSQFFFGKSHW